MPVSILTIYPRVVLRFLRTLSPVRSVTTFIAPSHSEMHGIFLQRGNDVDALLRISERVACAREFVIIYRRR